MTAPLLEDRLRSHYSVKADELRLPPMEFADVLERSSRSVQDEGEVVTIHDASRKRHHPRVFVLGIAVAAVVIATLAMINRPATHSVRPVDSTVSLEPTSTPTTATPTNQSEPSTTVVDLSGEGTGLYVDPAALPADFTVIRAGETDGPLGTSSAEGLSFATTLGRYNDDRSRLTEVIVVNTFAATDGVTPESLRGPGGVASQVRGLPAYETPESVTWLNGPFIVDVVRSYGTVDMPLLRALAAGVEVSSDGVASIADPPDGFEIVSTVPGTITDNGPSWRTTYASAQSTDIEPPVLAVTLTTHPGAPAESLLASLGAVIDIGPHAVDINGRRAIVEIRPGQTRDAVVTWDEPDGSQVAVEYRPLHQNLTPEQVSDQAVALAVAIRRADPTQWAQLQSDATSGLATLTSRQWITDVLAQHGLVESGPSSQPIVFAPTVFMVPTTTAAGADNGVCELVLRELVTCTRPDDPTLPGGLDIRVAKAPGGYIRILTGPAVAQVQIHTGGDFASNPVSKIFTAADSPGVAYFAAPSADSVCIELLDTSDQVLGRRGLNNVNLVDTCDAASPPRDSVAP